MAEWDQYVAAVDIYYPATDVGTLAYRVGDRVPVSNVVLHGYVALGWVTPVGSALPPGFASDFASDFA